MNGLAFTSDFITQRGCLNFFLRQGGWLEGGLVLNQESSFKVLVGVPVHVDINFLKLLNEPSKV